MSGVPVDDTSGVDEESACPIEGRLVTTGPQEPQGAGAGGPTRVRRRKQAGRRRLWVAAGLIVALLVTGSVVFAVVSGDDDDGGWNTYRATASDALLDTVGVAMHEHYTDTAYGETDLLALLDRLGVRHIRDALTPQSMAFYARFVEQAGPGAQVSYILNDGLDIPIEEQIRLVAEQPAGTTSQIEGDNEPDCEDWSDEEVQFYRDQAGVLRGLMDQYDTLRDVPLTTPSFCRTREERYVSYGDDGVSERFNVHPYHAGELPEILLPDVLEWVRAADPDAVPVATEAGYHNAVETEGDHKPTSLEAESAYLPQMFLEYNRRGVALVHTYELLDLRPDPDADYDQENFGLFNSDGTIKPSGASMAALLDALRDTDGPRPEPRDVEVATTDGGDALRVQPYLRSDGSVDVALWMAQPIWDEDERVNLPNPTTEVTVQVRSVEGDGSYVRIDGTEDPERVALPAGDSFTVPVSAHPTLLRIGG